MVVRRSHRTGCVGAHRCGSGHGVVCCIRVALSWDAAVVCGLGRVLGWGSLGLRTVGVGLAWFGGAGDGCRHHRRVCVPAPGLWLGPQFVTTTMRQGLGVRFPPSGIGCGGSGLQSRYRGHGSRGSNTSNVPASSQATPTPRADHAGSASNHRNGCCHGSSRMNVSRSGPRNVTAESSHHESKSISHSGVTQSGWLTG